MRLLASASAFELGKAMGAGAGEAAGAGPGEAVAAGGGGAAGLAGLGEVSLMRLQPAPSPEPARSFLGLTAAMRLPAPAGGLRVP